MRPKPVLSLPYQLLWAFIGLLLTIISTFIEASITNKPWLWYSQGIYRQSLGVTYQIGAVLLTGCMGGRNAGAISQIAYLTIGLLGSPIFARGGGLAYLQEPSFGYLIGFIPGAWLCGFIAWRGKPTIELFALSALCGLIVIHLTGLIYLLISYGLGNSQISSFNQLLLMIQAYCVEPLPGHLAIVCFVATIAYVLRRILFY